MEGNHLNKREQRYNINSTRESFMGDMLGLTVIELCITELCTRKCSFCPRSDTEVYPNRNLLMSVETADNLSKSCAKNNFEGDFHMSGFGESLTSKHVYDIIAVIRKNLPDNRIAMTSNADLMNVKKINRLVECGLNHIIISCYDGPEAYLKIEKMLKKSNIMSFDIRELWINPDETTQQMMERNNFNNRSGAIPDGDDENRERIYNIRKQCYLPSYKLVVDWDGSVIICCNDWLRRESKLGNVNTEDLKSIWLSDQFNEIRRKLADGDRGLLPACKHCNIKGTLVGKKSADLHVKSIKDT